LFACFKQNSMFHFKSSRIKKALQVRLTNNFKERLLFFSTH